jgi:glutamate---cysteine ligase / carboxylate-amine ligase
MTAAEPPAPQPRTVGIEEELLLVDPSTGRLAGVADELTDDPDDAGEGDNGDAEQWPSVEHEFKRQQIETATRPSTSIDELLIEVVAARRSVVERAVEHGVAPVALGSYPGVGRSRVTDDERYELMMRTFGIVASTSLACGMHVHVSVSSREEGVGVIDRIRDWLPVLLAMTANSPYYQGEDTGYASYRSLAWSLWPTAGPTDVFGDPAAYDREIESLVTAGAAVDHGMIYFDARLSAQYPTVEIRVMDICPTADDAVLMAALSRALVETAAGEWAAGSARSPRSWVSRGALRAATWRAARYGLTDQLVHPLTGRLAEASEVVSALVDHVGPALAGTGDLAAVTAGLARLHETGNGASRQRAVFAARRSWADVVATARDWTA